MVLWVRDHRGLALITSPLSLIHMHREAQAAPAAQGTTLGHQLLFPLLKLQPHPLNQLIKALLHGKEAGRISDKQVASTSSNCSLLTVSSDLESNPQQLQQTLATLVRGWRNSLSPH